MIRLYRLLLRAFPRDLRRAFGDEMVQLFEAQRRAAREAGEGDGRLWIRAVADALVHGAAERIAIFPEQCRSSMQRLAGWRRAKWRCWMRAFVHDLKHAIRLLVRQPGVTIVAIVTLALGIGANAAIFSAVDAILLRPLPYEDPDRLVMVWEKRQAEGVLDNLVAAADFMDWARMNTVFDSMAAFTPTTRDLTNAGDPARLAAGAVSPAFFEVFRVKPQLGRTFEAGEGMEGRNRVVVAEQ